MNRMICAFTALLCLSWPLCCVGQPHETMFLQNAAHAPARARFGKDCFSQLCWKTNADAALRTTPVADAQNLYFGSERGEFFCVSQTDGHVLWKYASRFPIHSSAAVSNGLVFFCDAGQTLYALHTNDGRVAWQTSLGVNMPYEWKFDFLWSSPTILEGTLYVGSGDGNLYAINARNGSVLWKSGAAGHIRCSPAVTDDKVFFGDMNGYFYALSRKTGKQLWRFETNGAQLVNDSFGYDRKGIVSSPVVSGSDLFFGSRDGFLYRLDAGSGKLVWSFDYRISWVISSVCVDEKAVYAGTSDGRFVNAINRQTGQELWRTPTSIIWSSPILVNDKLYVGGYDGALYCINKTTGAPFSSPLQTAGRIQSSPAVAGDRMFVSSDDGFIYALRASSGNCSQVPAGMRKYVFYDAGLPQTYFRNGTDQYLASDLRSNGFRAVNADGLEHLLGSDVAKDSPVVIVLATCYLPKKIIANGAQSLLRKFLNNGGRVVAVGMNPAIYKVDSATQEISADFGIMKPLFDIDYGYRDTRAHGGVVYCHATAEGRIAGMPEWWMAPFPVTDQQVDVVLGKDVSGKASAYLKRYNEQPYGGLLQLWIDAGFPPQDISFIRKAALTAW